MMTPILGLGVRSSAAIAVKPTLKANSAVANVIILAFIVSSLTCGNAPVLLTGVLELLLNFLILVYTSLYLCALLSQNYRCKSNPMLKVWFKVQTASRTHEWQGFAATAFPFPMVRRRTDLP
jgi:hypothetical protein